MFPYRLDYIIISYSITKYEMPRASTLLKVYSTHFVHVNMPYFQYIDFSIYLVFDSR